MLLRDKILAKKGTAHRDVFIPEWDATVRVKGMTAGGRAQFMNLYSDNNGVVNWSEVQHVLVLECLYDPEIDEPVFHKGDESSIDELDGKSVETITKTAMELSGLTEEASNDIAKNS